MLLRDSARYLILAERWHETGEYIQIIKEGVIVPPLPIFCVVKLMSCGFSAEVAGRSINLFLGAMITDLGYQIAHKAFKDKLLSAFTALLLIFHPILISYSIQPLRENCYLFFLGLAILETISGIKEKKIQNWGMCGVYLSFGLFCRYEAAEMLVICSSILVFLFYKKVIDLRKLACLLGVFLITNIATTSLLLSVTNYDISFLTKVSKYSDKIIQQTNVRDFIQNDPQSGE